MADYALKTREAGDLYVEYEPNDGNLSAAGGSMIVCLWVRAFISPIMGTLFDISGPAWDLRLFTSELDSKLYLLYPPMWAGGPSSYIWWWQGRGLVSAGDWHLLICEADYSGSAGSGEVRIWCDGEVKAYQPGCTWDTPETFTDFYVGAQAAGAHGNCDIDEFCVFDGYSTEDERLWLWNNGDGQERFGPGQPFANATRTFRAGFDAKSAVADYAAGTAEPIGGTAEFVDGFLFGKQLDWEEMAFELLPMPRLTFTVEGNEL